MKTTTTFLLLFYQLFLLGQFSEEHFAAVNREAQTLNIVDIDGDGDNDILAGFHPTNDSGLGWFKNVTGEGDFGSLIPLESNLESVSFATTADFNGDGKIDILAADYYMSWLPGLGNGDFESGIELNVNTYNAYIFVMDVDFDGDTDIAYDNSNGFFWLENDGTGVFTDEQILLTDIAFAKKDIVDMDNDGDGDLLVAKPGDISWYENDGGSFDSIHFISNSFATTYSLAVADLDEDEDEDFAIMGDNSTSFVWFENEDGFGNFSAPHLVYDTTGGFSYMWIQDMDGDSDNDIILSMSSNADLVWYENLEGMTSFASPKLINNFTNSHSLRWFGDLDSDNDIDHLCISGANSFHTYWIPNIDGLGNFGERKNILKRVVSHHIAPADIDGDGDTDLMVASDGVIWLENLDGFGDFSAPKDIEENTTTNDPYKLFPVDIDGDNDLDLLAAWTFDGHRWYENIDGNGNFGPPVFINTKTSNYSFFDDVDNDGDEDLISIHSQPHEIRWTEREANTFGAVHVITNETGSYPDVQFEDFDNDGDKDLILIQSWQENAIYWYENNSGNFGNKILIDDSDDEYKKIRLADIDNDGYKDLIFNELQAPFVSGVVWRKNLNGNGFGPEQTIQDDSGTLRDMLIIDVDENGFNDLITSASQSQEVKLFLNESGNFGPYQPISTETYWTGSMTTANINNNGGSKDLVMTATLDAAIVWYDNYYSSFIIEGITYWDENENQQKDSSEITLSSQQVLLEPQSVTSWTNGFGQFSYSIIEGDYQLSILPDNYWQSTGNSVVDISIDLSNGYAMHNFGLSPSVIIDEVSLDLSSGPTRCNQLVPFWLNCKNIGTTTAKGEIVVELDETVSFEASTPMPDEINGSILTWKFDGLSPTYNTGIDLVLAMPSADNIGDTLSIVTRAKLEDDIGAIIFEDEYLYESLLVCAFDPNDKLVDKPIIDFNQYEIDGSDLYYTIRFQNTGNATAYNVRIEDQLDQHLQWNTLEVIHSSHPYEVYLEDNGFLYFDFKSIMLPDHNTNELASQGFVKFKITLEENLPIMTLIENEASIFFDFNDPIITNKASTILETITTINGVTIQSPDFQIWPNPANGSAYISLKNISSQDWQITISSAMGQMIEKINSTDFSFQENVLELSQLKKGAYIISLDIGSEKISKKLIVVSQDDN